MCDFFHDFGENGFMDDESFEDSLEGEMDESFSDDTEQGIDTNEAESQGDFTAKDAFFAGSFAGWAYEEGLRERKRRNRKRFSDDSE